jgi:methyl-accepting chemotaxis protein
MIRKILGGIMLLIGLSGVTLSIIGIRLGRGLIDSIAGGIDNTLLLTSEGMDNVLETLVFTKAAVTDVNAALVTVEGSADDLSRTVQQTQPLLEQISTVAADEVPNSLESIEMVMPTLEQVAGVIDSTLVTLNKFRIDEEIFGIEIQYDLGINYAPEVPFDVSVNQLGSSLDGLPESLRNLQGYMDVTSGNLDTISRDIHLLADDVGKINGRISELPPIIDEYIRIATEIGDDTRQIRAQIGEHAQTAKTVVTIVIVWLGLTQVAPLYLGLGLVIEKREEESGEELDEESEASAQ